MIKKKIKRIKGAIELKTVFTFRSSGGVVNKQARTTAKMADYGNKFNVPGCATDVKCSDGLVSLFRKVQKANNAL